MRASQGGPDRAATLLQFLTQRKTKGHQLKGKIVSALFRTFPHFFTLLSHLFFTLFRSFSHIFTLFPPGRSLKIKPFLRRTKENKKEKTKPFDTLVVARLSSSDYLPFSFARLCFLFSPCPPHPSSGNFFPSALSLWDLTLLVEDREPARAGFWGVVWTGSLHYTAVTYFPKAPVTKTIGDLQKGSAEGGFSDLF